MKDYDKIEALERILENEDKSISEYENEYKDKVKYNKEEKNKLIKYLIPLIILDVILMSLGEYVNLHFSIDSYVLSSCFVMLCIPNVLLLDKYILLFKSIKDTKNLDDVITYLKEERIKKEEKINELKHEREPIYISKYSYSEDNTLEQDDVKRLVKKKNQ